MRILQFCKKLPYPPKDGESIAILNISKGLAEAGHEVTVFAINTKRHRGRLDAIPSALKDLVHFHAVDLDTDPHWWSALLNLAGRKSYHISRFYHKNVLSALRAHLESVTYDVIQLEGLFGLQYLEDIRSWQTSPIVYRAHNIEYRIWNRLLLNEPNPIKRNYLEIQTKRLHDFERKMVTQVDGWVPISPLDGDLLRELDQDMPKHVSPATVRLEDWSRELVSQEQRTIGFLGGLDWMPNQEGLRWFIEKAMPSIRKAVEGVELHIAGRNQPEWMASWRTDDVFIHGEVEDAGSFLADKSVIIVPLLSGSGMRIKIIEAMAASKAIVSTSIGAEGIPVQDGKDISLADYSKEFAESVSRLLIEPDTADEMARQARATVEQHFDYRPVCRKLAEFYEALISVHR